MAAYAGTENAITTIDGLFKRVYADKMTNLVPDGKKLVEMVNFLPKQKAPGASFQQAVILG